MTPPCSFFGFIVLIAKKLKREIDKMKNDETSSFHSKKVFHSLPFLEDLNFYKKASTTSWLHFLSQQEGQTFILFFRLNG